MLQIIAGLVYLGFGVVAGLLNASQRERYNQSLSHHQQTLSVCQQRIESVTRRAADRVALVQAKAEYRAAIAAGNAAWAFMNTTRDDLNQIWDAIHALRSRISSASSTQRYEIVAAIKELRFTHEAMRTNLMDLKERVRSLNQQTGILRQRFATLGEAGLSYYQHLQDRQRQRISG